MLTAVLKRHVPAGEPQPEARKPRKVRGISVSPWRARKTRG